MERHEQSIWSARRTAGTRFLRRPERRSLGSRPGRHRVRAQPQGGPGGYGPGVPLARRLHQVPRIRRRPTARICAAWSGPGGSRRRPARSGSRSKPRQRSTSRRILPLVVGVLGVLAFFFGFLSAWKLDQQGSDASISVYATAGAYLPILLLLTGLLAVAPLIPKGRKYTLPTALLAVVGFLAALTQLISGDGSYGANLSVGVGLILLLVVSLFQAGRRLSRGLPSPEWSSCRRLGRRPSRARRRRPRPSRSPRRSSGRRTGARQRTGAQSGYGGSYRPGAYPPGGYAAERWRADGRCGRHTADTARTPTARRTHRPETRNPYATPAPEIGRIAAVRHGRNTDRRPGPVGRFAVPARRPLLRCAGHRSEHRPARA